MSDKNGRNTDTRRVSLVTGATGMIGRALVEQLVKRGDDVHVITRDAQKAEAIWGPRKVTVHQCEVWHPESIRSVYSKVRPDEIYHLAASLMAWGVTEGLETLTRVNILGTAVCMEALEVSPHSRFVYVDSFAVVGGVSEPVREDHPFDPQEFYSISKLAGTLEGRQLARNKGYSIVTGRIFTAYGPGIPKGKLVEQVISKSLRNETIILTHPEVSRDFIFIDDIAACLISLASIAEMRHGEVFNVGSGKATSLGELAALVKELTGSASQVKWQPERRTAYEMFPWEADMSKTWGAIPWRPNVSLQDGLSRTIEWIKTHNDQ